MRFVKAATWACVFGIICSVDVLHAQDSPRGAQKATDTILSNQSSEERKELGRQIFESELKRHKIPFDKEFQTTQDRLENSLKRNSQSLADLRTNDGPFKYRSYLIPGLRDSLNRDALQTMDALESLKKDRERALRSYTWLDISHEKRLQIVKSGCLSDQELHELLAVQDAPDKSTFPYLSNSLGMRFVLIPAGTFLFGQAQGSPGEQANKGRLTEISKPFLMAEFEVTTSLFARVARTGTSSYTRPNGSSNELYDPGQLPVANVSWFEAVRFCKSLSELPEEKILNRFYRLPTEAEWEYACRANNDTIFGNGNQSPRRRKEANLGELALSGEAKPVGHYPPNEFALFDMHGNVSEWCGDWFEVDYPKTAPTTDPIGPTVDLDLEFSADFAIPGLPEVKQKVYRGSSYRTSFGSSVSYSSLRFGITPTAGMQKGFRVVCEKDKPSEITKRQYADLSNFDAGHYQESSTDIRRAYLVELDRRIGLLENASANGLRSNENWLSKASSPQRRYSWLSGLSEEKGIMFSDLDEKEHSQKAYQEAARYGEAYIAAEQKGPNQISASDELENLITVGNLYRKGGDLKRATEILESVFKVDPRNASARALQIWVDQDAARSR